MVVVVAVVVVVVVDLGGVGRLVALAGVVVDPGVRCINPTRKL